MVDGLWMTPVGYYCDYYHFELIISVIYEIVISRNDSVSSQRHTKNEGKMKENKRKTIRKEVISKKRKDETERDDIAVFIWKTMCLLMGER